MILRLCLGLNELAHILTDFVYFIHRNSILDSRASHWAVFEETLEYMKRTLPMPNKKSSVAKKKKKKNENMRGRQRIKSILQQSGSKKFLEKKRERKKGRLTSEVNKSL